MVDPRNAGPCALTHACLLALHVTCTSPSLQILMARARSMVVCAAAMDLHALRATTDDYDVETNITRQRRVAYLRSEVVGAGVSRQPERAGVTVDACPLTVEARAAHPRIPSPQWPIQVSCVPSRVCCGCW
ncbi:hypothetical protein Rwratislav_40770 [Rhodococcus wratislaviensis IFP 2016]|nr:hypothetical protein Rwratislav_40770 [Rhodococcus wratislaviensis IFP 2016]